jgi:Mrp family chromosome partitioning ATPase
MYGLTALLAERFDLVIFDTPPAFNAADAATLAQTVDGIVMVVRSFSTERDIAVSSLDILRHARGNVLGTVLNNVDVPRGGYYGYGKSYYYYYHPYDSYYSDDDGASGRGKKRRSKQRGGKPPHGVQRDKKDDADIGREKAPGSV